jgi:hypothetical protein
VKPLESDWKYFKELVPSARERFLQCSNEELLAILSQKDKTSTEIFWEAKNRIDEQADILEGCLRDYSRSKMWTSILTMRQYGLIRDQDLEPFSDSLRQDVLGFEMTMKSRA